MSDIYTNFDFDRAVDRISLDIQSDFILIPQFSDIYRHAPDKLKETTRQYVSRGRTPQPPIIIEVAKPNGLTRPGASLYPVDRLLYQSLADLLAPIIETAINRNVVHSYKLNTDINKSDMFVSPSECHRELRESLRNIAYDDKLRYAVVSDVHCYFESINLHEFQGILEGSVSARINDFLHEFLKSLRTRNSRGLLQGLQPSDLLGNYYLSGFDHHIDSLGIKHFRYVDDMYFFFSCKEEALRFRALLPSLLRDYHLTVNEVKTRVIETSSLYYEETEIDKLFSDAKEEVEQDLEHLTIDLYGSEIFSEEPETFNENVSIDLSAVKRLIDSIPSNMHVRDKIFTFGLPKLALAKDDYALKSVIANFSKIPHLSRAFVSYLAHLSQQTDFAADFIENNGGENLYYASQLMWYFILLRHIKAEHPDILKFAEKTYHDRNTPLPVRGAACLYLARCGGAMERKRIRESYDSETELIKSYILYATSDYPMEERRALQKSWGQQSDINRLIIDALKEKNRA